MEDQVERALEEDDAGFINIPGISSPGKPAISMGRAQVPVPEEAPKGSLAAALFRRETTIGSLLSEKEDGSFVPGQTDPNAYFSLVPEFNMYRSSAYALDTNQEEADRTTRRLALGDEDRFRAESAGLRGFVTGIGVQALDPINYMPGGVIFRNYKIASRAGRAALESGTSGLVSTAAQEFFLQGSQLDRSIDESYANILAGGLFSATIGGVAGAITPGVKSFTAAQRKRITDELADTITDKTKALTKDGTVDPNDPIFPEFVKKALVTSTKNRMLKSPFSTAKETSDLIYAADFNTIKNQDGVASKNVERMVSLDITKTLGSMVEYQDIFFKQAGASRGLFAFSKANKRAAEEGNNMILNFETFNKEVAGHMFLDTPHRLQSVNDAIRLAREKIINPFTDKAIELDMLPDGVSPKNAANYFPVVWNRKLVLENQPQFEKEVFAGFSEVNNANKAVRSSPEYKSLDAEVKSLEKELKQLKKTGQKKEVKALEKKLDDKKSELGKTIRNLAGRTLDEFEVEALFHTKGKKAGKLRDVSSDVELQAAVIRAKDNILGRGDSKINNRIISELDGKPSPMTDRTFLLSQKRMQSWHSQSAPEVLGRYIHSMAPAIRMTEMAREQGHKSISDWHNALQAKLKTEFQAANKDLEGSEAVKLDKEFRRQEENITNSFKTILGIYGDGPNVHDGSYAKLYKTLLDWNYIRLLGFMTLSSVADVGMHVFKHGPFQAVYNGLLPVLKGSLSSVKNMSKDDARALGVAINTVNGSRLKALAGNEDFTNEGSYFGRTFDRMVVGFGNVTLMNQWNDAGQMIASTTSINRSLKTIEAMFTPGRNVRQKDRERLARLGLSEDEAKEVLAMWIAAGRTEVDGTYFANWNNWKVKTNAQLKALESFQAATLQEVNETVIRPGLGDKPQFAQKGIGKVLLQFKSFSFAATNKITFAAINRRDSEVLSGMLTLLSMGALSYVVTQVLRGNEPDLSFENLAQEAIDRSGLLGIGSEVYNLAAKAGLGFGGPASRYQSRGLWGALLGPSTGLVEDLLFVINRMRSASDEDPLTTKDLEKLLRLAPYQNLFYTYYLSRQLIAAGGPSIGFQKTPEQQPDQFKDIF